jgi:cysteine-rich repeat protein
VSGNTNLTKPKDPVHSMSPCSSIWADGWYPFTAPISGVVTARIASATFRSTIAVRSACAPSGTQLTCDGEDQKGGQEIVFAVNAGSTYWLGIAGGHVVSGRPEIGRFTVDVNLVPTGCGDTFINPPEQCDDGNTVNGDGCSSTCTVEPLAGVQSCPGHAVTLTGSGNQQRRATVTVDTTGLPSNTGSQCGGSGPEGVLVVTPDVDGYLSVKATASHSVVVYARTTCNDPSTEVAKGSCTSSSSLTSVATSVKKNTPYYVYVDGLNGAAGVTKLQIAVTP